MIIFGSKSKLLGSSATTADCNHCGSVGTVHLSFITKYFHIFWIPMFPYGKKGVSECSHCKQVLYENQMPGNLKAVYEVEKAKAKIPLGYRFGQILIGLFFAFSIFSVVFSKVSQPSTDYIKTAQPNDIYQIKFADRNFGIYKVLRVEGDKVFAVRNNETPRKKSDVDKTMEEFPDDYNLNEEEFSKQDLEKRINNGSLFKIIRQNE